MFRIDDKGNKRFYCDICGEEIKTDREAVNMVFSKPNARRNGIEEHYFRNICGACMLDAELCEIWKERKICQK